MTIRQFLWVAIAGLNSGASHSHDRSISATLRLELPVFCSIPADCLVQKLVDIDASAKRLDYRCGSLTTNDHDGIDIRVRTLADMRNGVAVLVAAGGRVLRVRDGEPDGSRSNLSGRDAGNAVVVDHGSGWETQYSHLRNGTVLVRPGMTLNTGDRIGSIGMSGNAEFPHLHFTVRHNGKPIDPFTGLSPPSPCISGNASTALWSPNAARALSYRSTAIISVGFSNTPPSLSVTDRDRAIEPTKAATPLILWADVMGAIPGDIQNFEIHGADGALLFKRTSSVEQGGLSWLAYAGRKAPDRGWPKGVLTGRYELSRSGTIVDARVVRLTIG